MHTASAVWLCFRLKKRWHSLLYYVLCSVKTNHHLMQDARSCPCPSHCIIVLCFLFSLQRAFLPNLLLPAATQYFRHTLKNINQQRPSYVRFNLTINIRIWKLQKWVKECNLTATTNGTSLCASNTERKHGKKTDQHLFVKQSGVAVGWQITYLMSGENTV